MSGAGPAWTATAVYIVPIEEAGPARGDWITGPLRLPWNEGVETDEGVRSSYFEKRAAAALYGGRRHVLLGGDLIEVVERCGGSDGLPPVALVHARAHGFGQSDVQSLRDLAYLGGKGGPHPVVDALRRVGLEPVLSRSPRAYSVVFLEFPCSAEAPETAGLGWPADYGQRGWLWLAATLAPLDSVYPPTKGMLDTELARVVEFSANWSALVLRDGAGFVWLQDQPASASFGRDKARILTRTVYADALAMGEWQRLELSAIADNLAQVESVIDSQKELESYEDRLARFQVRLWWRQLTRHGHANDLLRAHAAQHRLDELQDQVAAELESHTRRASARAAAHLNALLAIVTVVGLPVALVAAVLQTAGVTGWAGALSFAGVTSGIVLIVLLSRPGRLLLRYTKDYLWASGKR